MLLLRLTSIVLVPVTLGIVFLMQQDPIQISGDPTCPTCEVELIHLATIGDHEGEGILAAIGFVQRDSRGRFYTVTDGDPSSVRVFNADGSFLTGFGREGRGPMEFRHISGILPLPGDTLLIFDYSSAHATLVSPSYELVRTFPFPVRVRFPEYAYVIDGTPVVNGIAYSSDAYGHPFHVLERNNEVTSFGYDDRLVTPRTRDAAIFRTIAPVRGERSFWAAALNEYRIEQWSVDGALEHVLERRVPWFTPFPDEADRTVRADNPPRTQLFGLHQDDHGLLWVFMIRADPSWREGIRREPDPVHGGTNERIVDYDLVYDTVIEILDPEQGALVASVTLDEALRSRGSMIMRVRETTSGAWTADLFEYRLNGN